MADEPLEDNSMRKKSMTEFPRPTTTRPSLREEPLRTLKELAYCSDNNEWTHVSIKILRAEAIRWVKEMRKSDRYWSVHDEEIIPWIMHFFNLTEEDLK